MFPSPGPASMLQQLQSGGATPSTLEFHRTALNAARKNGAPTSNPQESELLQQTTTMEMNKPGPPMDPFTHPDATDAANGLYMLAKGGQTDNGQFAQPGSQAASVRDAYSRHHTPLNGGLGMIRSGDDPNGSASDGTIDQAKPNGRSKGKRAAPKTSNSANGRRKAEDSSKGANKKAKGSNGSAIDKLQDEEDLDMPPANGKKMTDDEKRKNFLERNRYVLSSLKAKHFLAALANILCAVSLLLNVVSERSNGSRIFKPKSKCTPKRMTISPPLLPNYAKKSFLSSRYSLRTRTVRSLKPKD